MPENSKRIVSLLASATEIICALGFEKNLVGRSHECDFPPSVLDLPQCTETKFLTQGSSKDIDDRIKTILQDGLSVYRVIPEKLNALRPDVLVTQVQCEVCAVSLKDVEAAVHELITTHPKIITLNPNSLDDIWTDIRNVAKGLGSPERGEDLITELKARMDSIVMRGDLIPQDERPRVASIEWIEPLMTGGNWMPELITMAGGRNLFGEAGKHSPMLSWEDLVSANPDVLFISPCGFDIERTRQEMKVLTQRPEWKTLNAVSHAKVFLGDGNQYFNRPGPRVVESLEILAEILHPDLYDYGHEGSGWARFTT